MIKFIFISIWFVILLFLLIRGLRGQKIDNPAVGLIYHLGLFILFLTALYIIKAGLGLYFHWKLFIKKGNYGPFEIAIDNLEHAIEMAQPIFWMSLGGAIVLVVGIWLACVFTNWTKIAKELDPINKLNKEIRDTEEKYTHE